MKSGTQSKACDACYQLIHSKMSKSKAAERLEFGFDSDKIEMKTFLKIVERESIEINDLVKQTVKRLKNRVTPEAFNALIAESRNYTDSQFLADIADLFGNDEARFIQKLLKSN